MLKNQRKRIYLDNSASTKTDFKVFKKINLAEKKFFANPSSVHQDGRLAFSALEKARKSISLNLGALPDEIIFTSGGTEGNTLVVFGLLNHLLSSGKKPSDLHLMALETDHPSIIENLKKIKKLGAKVDFLSVDENGFLNLKELKEKISKKTILISLSYGNSEIGTIQNIKEIMKIIRHFRKVADSAEPFVHLDACQGFLLDLNIFRLGIDFMTLDGQKIYGPKGSGILFKKRGIKIEPLFRGGGQESDFRSGTENVPADIGFAEALDLVQKNKISEARKISELRDWLWQEIQKEFSSAILNGSLDNRLPGNLNFSLLGFDRELLVFRLDASGISISAGSACQAGEDSHVLRAITKDKKRWDSAIRISLGRFNTKDDCRRLLKGLKEATKIELKSLSF